MGNRLFSRQMKKSKLIIVLGKISWNLKISTSPIQEQLLSWLTHYRRSGMVQFKYVPGLVDPIHLNMQIILLRYDGIFHHMNIVSNTEGIRRQWL